MYVLTKPICHEQDVIQGQFFSGVNLVWIQSLAYQGSRTQNDLLFSKSWGENRWIDAFSKGIHTKWECKHMDPGLSQGHSHHVKC